MCPSITMLTVENIATLWPAAWSPLAIMFVVVVFPFVPVTPITIMPFAGLPESQYAIIPRI